MKVNFSLSLDSILLQQKMYSPHEIEAEILITPTNIDKTTRKANLSKEDLLDMFANKRVSLTYSNRNENDEDVTYTVGNDFYVHEVVPVKHPDKTYVTLKIYSPDKLLTLTPYSRSWTAKKLSADILKAELPNYKLPWDRNNSVSAHTSQMKHILKSGQEHIFPYLVQYNESFYDLLARTTNRWGEFMYYYDGQLHIGLDDDAKNAEEIIDGYKSISYRDCTSAQPRQDNPGPLVPEAPYDSNVLNSTVVKDGAAKVFATINNMTDLEAGADYYWLKKVGQVLTNNKSILNFMFDTAVGDLLSWAQADVLAQQYNDKHNDAYFKKKKKYVSMLDEQYDNSKKTLNQFSEANPILKAQDYAAILTGEMMAERNTIEIDYDTFAPSLHLGQLIKVDNKLYVVSELTARTETVNSYKIENNTNVVVVPISKLVFRVKAIGINDDKQFYPLMIPSGHVRQSGPQVAVVVDVDDPNKKNRVRVKYPWQLTSVNAAYEAITAPDLKGHDVSDASPWLLYAASSGPASAGVHGRHYLAEKVLVNYANNNVERPFVVGAVSKDTPGSLKTGSAVMQAPNGQFIKVHEGSGKGATAFMANFTPGLSLANGFLDIPDFFGDDNQMSKAFEGGVQMGDRYGIWSISGSTDKRAIDISSPWGNVSINAFTGITVNAPNGDIKIKGKNVSIEAGNNLSLVSGTNIRNKFASSYGDGALFNFASFWYDVQTMVAKKVASLVESVFDLSLIRSLIEVYWRPQEGALSVQSNRYLMLSAGGAKPGYPYEAYKDPKKRIQKDVSDSGMLNMGPIMEELLGKLPLIVDKMTGRYKEKYRICILRKDYYDNIFSQLHDISNEYGMEAPCNKYIDLKDKFWNPNTKEITEADLDFKDCCKSDSNDNVDESCLAGCFPQADLTNAETVTTLKTTIINQRKSLKARILESANALLESINSLRTEPQKLDDLNVFGIGSSKRNAPADYINAVKSAFSKDKCKDSTFFQYAYDEQNAITDARANLTTAALDGLDLHVKALTRRVALNLVESWGMDSQPIAKQLQNNQIVDSNIAQKPAKPVSDADFEDANKWSLYVSSLEFGKPITKQGGFLDEVASAFDPSNFNLATPIREYSAWGNAKTGQILFGTGATLSMKSDGTISKLDTRYNQGKISKSLKNDKENGAYDALNQQVQDKLKTLDYLGFNVGNLVQTYEVVEGAAEDENNNQQDQQPQDAGDSVVIV